MVHVKKSLEKVTNIMEIQNTYVYSETKRNTYLQSN